MDLLIRYASEVVPGKAQATQMANHQFLKPLLGWFGGMPMKKVRLSDVHRYFNERDAKVSAEREIEVLSHAFTKAVEWGYVQRHPFKGDIHVAPRNTRTRYVEDWEIVAACAIPALKRRGGAGSVQAYIRLKLLTGLRRNVLLRLREADCKQDGLYISGSELETPLVYKMSESLADALHMAHLAKPIHDAQWLFCNRSGTPYVDELTGSSSGWKSIWRRFMDRVLAETEVSERFTEHDLRFKCAQDCQALRHGKALPGHTDVGDIDKILTRRPTLIRPLR